ncbi:unnamed protein product [Rangifer tarandus platyrhynchus]|uniref:Uncharacterized protein n=1 Tax=Rangifer tarandus platyrhynchus TaxID=3082113 RepID=A0ABN8Z1L7_RANTA|nr:unnamed protein product [Rangifer tarandus platyrhynchus]
MEVLWAGRNACAKGVVLGDPKRETGRRVATPPDGATPAGPPPPPSRTQRSRQPLRSPGSAIGREPAWGGGSGGEMRSCVTGEGGEKGGERPGARERERAASEEGGREAGPPTWGALARSQLAGRGRESPGEADKCGHIGRRGARRGAHGPRLLRPAEAAPSRPPRSGPGPRRRSRGPAVTQPGSELAAPGPGHSPRRTRRRRRPGLTMVAARAQCPRVAGRRSRSAG